MKIILVFLFFNLLVLPASAQYGSLVPLRDWDTVNVILRTPKDVIAKLQASKDKTIKKRGTLIQTIERQLEFARGAFLINRVPTLNTVAFTNNVKSLRDLDVDVNYYVQEFFIYYPNARHPPVRQ